MLLILTIAAAILEYGSLFGSTIDVSATSRSAARAGTATTSEPASDYDIVQTVVQKPGGKRTGIEKIVVYKSGPGQNGPPKQCMEKFPPPPGLRCNVFRPSEFDLSEAQLAASPGAQSWPPGSRAPGSDYLGVWVQVKRTPLVNLVWSPSGYTDYFVMRMDPAAVVSPAAKNPTDFTTNTDTLRPYNSSWKCWDGICPPAAHSGADKPLGGSGGSA